MLPLTHCAHFDFDGAWPRETFPGFHHDCRSWGPRLRYNAKARDMEVFHEFARERFAPFTLFGSGDFHHATALWLRQFTEPFVLVSFDNHPDWDIRPPRWSCGSWINRALELPLLERAAIWGCGNFELNWPGHLFVNGRALSDRKLAVFPWSERLNRSGRRRWLGMTRWNWRTQFTDFARRLEGGNVYVTVDLDCLREGEAFTNWEQGLFTTEDVCWAIGEFGAHGQIVGGDVCGARSDERYARWFQRVSAKFDHPHKPAPPTGAAAVNARALAAIWAALTNRHDRHAGDDQDYAEPQAKGDLLV